MTAKPTSKTQNLLIALVVLACFVAIFCMYHEPTRTWFKCPAAQILTNNVSAELCLHLLKMKNYTHDCNGNSETRQVQHPRTTARPPTTTTAKQLTTAKSEPETIILIWMWPFGVPFTVEPCTIYGVDGCRITDDRNLYNQADGVMIHHRDISGDFSNIPQQPRPVFQKWVWWNMESPTHSPHFPQLKEMFNLTSSYRRDSDIPVPYGSLVQTGEEINYTIPKKDKLVCWIVSNWNPGYKRTGFFNEFSKHIAVEGYGGHFNRPMSQDDYSKTVASCKFYLSFENSVHKDYITEKLFNSLHLGTVPVVLGPPRQNYEEYIPSTAFIHIDDFKTPKELAEHLKSLDQNEELYMQHFTWKKHFTVTHSRFGTEHSCLTCAHIRRFKSYKRVTDLNGWWFV